MPTALAPEQPLYNQVPGSPVVNSPDDDGTGCTVAKCTLRDAIEYADPGAKITFASGLSTIVLTQDQLTIDKDLTIEGPGAHLLTVTRSSDEDTPEFRIFFIEKEDEEVTVTISGLTITGGVASKGGGIWNAGARFTLSNSIVTGNTANGEAALGGGIRASGVTLISHSVVSGNTAIGEWDAGGGGFYTAGGTVTISYSTISNNTVSAPDGEWGGGIYNDGGANLTVTHSTLSGNSAGSGGGIYSSTFLDDYVITTIINTTISGNTATRKGGGVRNVDGSTRIVHSTITNNAAAEGGGGVFSYNDAGTRTDVKGSIIWGNTGAGGTADDVAADEADNRYASLGYNLIGAAGASVDFAEEFSGPTDQTNVFDAGLVPLAQNSPGATATHALQPDSPALDAIPEGACVDHEGSFVQTDQRGVHRPQGSGCDIGAFERGSISTPAFASSCTFTIHPKNGQRQVTVAWENAVPGVTQIQVKDGRVVTKQMAPTASGTWSTSVKEDPTYALWGGDARRDASVSLVPETACVGPN